MSKGYLKLLSSDNNVDHNQFLCSPNLDRDHICPREGDDKEVGPKGAYRPPHPPLELAFGPQKQNSRSPAGHKPVVENPAQLRSELCHSNANPRPKPN